MFQPETILVEMVPPARDKEKDDASFLRFSKQYDLIMKKGYIASISDNVIGSQHYEIDEVFDMLKLEEIKNHIIAHVTSSHSPDDLLRILRFCDSHEISHILCLTGDDSMELSELKSCDIGGIGEKKANSVDLVRFIKREFPKLIPGVAFNPYRKDRDELNYLSEKINAGAEFVITQPLLDRTPIVDLAISLYPDIPFIIGVWMSHNTEILSFITGQEIHNFSEDRKDALHRLQTLYPMSANYLAMISLKDLEDLS